MGNRSTQTLNGQVHADEYWPSSNRIKAIPTGTLTGAIEKAFAYDDEGRLTTQTGAGAKTLTWDQKNRARQIASGTSTLGFAYDPMNYRIGRNAGTLGNRDYYLEGEHLEAEYAGANLQAKYFRGLSTDELVAGFAYDASGNWLPAIYHHDTLMSVTRISAHDGATVQTASYSAFGDRTVAGSGASTNRLKYTGREFDQDTGLYYYRARYYDPAIGRFVSEDPLGFAAGINFYAYCGNNPVIANDPSGQDFVVDPWLWINIAAGAASLAHNVHSGNWGWAALDTAGLVYDGVAAVVPFLPAGASAGITALRAGNTVVHSLQVASDVTKVAKVADDAAKAASMTARAVDAGRAAHSEVATVLEEGSMLSSSANNYFKGANGATGIQADLSWTNAPGVWADLTTVGQWSRHVDKYAPTFGEGIPLLYQRGLGLVDTLQLIPGAGVGLGALQLGADSFAGQAAAGGFLLYSNKPNTNQERSVYSK